MPENIVAQEPSEVCGVCLPDRAGTANSAAFIDFGGQMLGYSDVL